MAVDIRAELQPINDLLIAIDCLAKTALDVGMRHGDAPNWAVTLECLSEKALEVCGDAEMSIRQKLGGS